MQTYYVKPYGCGRVLFPNRELAEAERRSLISEYPDDEVHILPGPEMTEEEFDSLVEHPGY